MGAMLGNADVSLDITPNIWTNVHSNNATAYLKSKTLAEKSAWEFIRNQKGDDILELVVVNPGPIYGPTLSGNLSGESMQMYEKLIQGGLPILPQSSINMSDVRDIAYIQVKALENKEANGKRFIVASKKPHSFVEMAQTLKDNGYNKVSTKIAPNFIFKFMANFNRQLKAMRPFIGNTYNADVSETTTIFQWEPIAFKKMVLDTAKSVSTALDR